MPKNHRIELPSLRKIIIAQLAPYTRLAPDAVITASRLGPVSWLHSFPATQASAERSGS